MSKEQEMIDRLDAAMDPADSLRSQLRQDSRTEDYRAAVEEAIDLANWLSTTLGDNDDMIGVKYGLMNIIDILDNA